MSNIDIEEILKKLSTKFNRIFCDREFVCCVYEDFQVILKNKNKCCVVVFPALGPNYLKAVRYQAKIFDLTVFTLGSEQICSIAVCHKEHLIKKIEETEEQIMPEREQEIGGSKLKKKRPERPLYVPPAQRRLPAHDTKLQHNSKYGNDNNEKIKKTFSTLRKESTAKTKVQNSQVDKDVDFEKTDEEQFTIKFNEDSFERIYEVVQWEYKLSDTVSNSGHFTKNYFRHSLRKRCLFSCGPKFKILHFLRNDFYLWQPAMNIGFSDRKTCANVKIIPTVHLEVYDNQCSNDDRMSSLLVGPALEKMYDVTLKDISVFWDYSVLWIKNEIPNDDQILNLCGEFYYLTEDDYFKCNEDLMESIYKYLNGTVDSVKTAESHRQHSAACDSHIADNQLSESTDLIESIEEPYLKEEPIESKKSPVNTSNSKRLNESDKSLQNNNIKNNVTNYCNTNENVKSTNEIDEEKEIMRKAKENMNRRSRPIMKYVEANNTLEIEKNENVSNWEDLFDEHGQLPEDLLKEIVHKVGSDVTIVKAKEDYSDYFTKQIEELEHMVELFDFPSSFETHDLIQAFSDINSDAMYVKWVDDTHAILVLGSFSQAQKAITKGHPLISVRPMTAASKVSLAAAHKHDLRPAMKRPQTNLQTARRLITSHLGKKTGISRDRSARERDDLKAAKEMKKLVKKNEQDAWEGNLRSSKTE